MVIKVHCKKFMSLQLGSQTFLKNVLAIVRILMIQNS